MFSQPCTEIVISTSRGLYFLNKAGQPSRNKAKSLDRLCLWPPVHLQKTLAEAQWGMIATTWGLLRCKSGELVCMHNRWCNSARMPADFLDYVIFIVVPGMQKCGAAAAAATSSPGPPALLKPRQEEMEIGVYSWLLCSSLWT